MVARLSVPWANVEPVRTAHRSPTLPVTTLSATFVALAYLASFGPGVYVSIVVLLNDVASDAASSPVDELISRVFLVGVGLILGYGATQCLGRSWTREWLRGRRSSTPGSGILSAGAALGALMLGYWAIGPFVSPTYTHSREADGSMAIATVKAFIGAGVAEEFIVLALPVVLLRAAAPNALRGRWLALTLGVLVSLRMAFHLYYGWWALTLLPWAVVASAAYLRWGRVWPLVFQHTAYNMALAAIRADLVDREATLATLSLTAGFCVILGWLLISRHRTSRLRFMQHRESGFTAQFDSGTCTNCGDPIEAGQEIANSYGGQVPTGRPVAPW